jgi:NAD(P)-dependent dehydrogenase (short-subunit alcohol dehydrogenase family)
MHVNGTAAVITGGTSGLGLAAAQRLVATGTQVVLLGRDPQRARDACALLGKLAHFVPGDVTSAEDVDAAIAAAEGLGRFTAAVNCAGVARSAKVLNRDRRPLAMTEFDYIVRVNLLGTFNLVRLAAEAMSGNEPVDGERGVIVCTSSIAAFDGQQGQAAYAASKAGIVGMTLPLARDLARHAIRIVTVAPGLFDTPMFGQLGQDARDALVASTPHPKRLGRPDEFGALVAHIVENTMLNGEVIRIDGANRLGFA